jgi:ankyrin repeat protein
MENQRTRSGRLHRQISLICIVVVAVSALLVAVILSRHRISDNDYYEMIEAANRRDTSLLEHYLDHGLDPNAPTSPSGKSLMIIAVGSDNPEMLRVLLRHGGNAALEEPPGEPLLNTAASWSTGPEVIKLLIQNGALPNKLAKDGLAPLGRAALAGQAGVAKALIEEGADPNARNAGGMTPLQLAAYSRKPAVALVLLDAGANVNPIDDSGGTPMDYVSGFPEEGAREVSDLLRQHGGLKRKDLPQPHG